MPVAGVVLAYALSRVPLPGRYPATMLFIVSFAVTLPFWREPEVIVDSSRYFTQAKHLEVYGIGYFLREWGKAIPAWTDMPAVPFLYGLILKLSGETRAYIQMFTSSLFALTIMLTYRIGKTLWSRELGFYAGVSLLAMPYLYTQAPLMLVDVPTTFMFTLSVYTFIMALKHGRSWIPAASAALFIAFFSKYSTWLMLSGLGVIFLVYSIRKPEAGGRKRDSGRKAASRGLVTAFIASLLIGFVVWHKFDVFSEQIRFLMAYQKPGLRRWGESFVSTFLFQVHPFITIAAAYSLYAAFKKRDLSYLIIIWPVLLLFLLQIKRIRYSMPVFPMLALMASYGLCAIRNREAGKSAALCAMAFSLVLATFAYSPFLHKTSSVNIKHAGEYLNALDIRKCEVFVLPPEDPVLNAAVSVPLLDIFTDKDIRYEYTPLPRPPREEVEKSPLRFTWEYRNPAYYGPEAGGTGKTAVVVISGKPGKELPDPVRERIEGLAKKEFSVNDEIFIDQTLVTVYY